MWRTCAASFLLKQTTSVSTVQTSFSQGFSVVSCSFFFLFWLYSGGSTLYNERRHLYLTLGQQCVQETAELTSVFGTIWMKSLDEEQKILQQVANNWLTGHNKTLQARTAMWPTSRPSLRARRRVQDFTLHKNTNWRVEHFPGSVPHRWVCHVTAAPQPCGDPGKYRARQHRCALQLGRGLQVAVRESVFPPRSARGRSSVRRKATGLSPRRRAAGQLANWWQVSGGRRGEQPAVPTDQIDKRGK